MATGSDKKWVRLLVGASPSALVCIYGLLLYLPFTRDFALSLRGEKGLIEITTFLFLFAAGLYGIYVTRQAHKASVGKWITGFYLLFTLGAILTAMEEIAWGQWFFGVDHPRAIHNLAPFQGHTEYFRVFFGVAGLIRRGCHVA